MKPHDLKGSAPLSLTSPVRLPGPGPNTLTDSLTDLPRPPQVSPDDGGGELPLDENFLGRYQHRAQIGEGGMGEVRLALDGRIGREVAMKVVRVGDEGSQRDRQQRFLREARIQAQLEHPSIVPVYDLGRDPAGAQYFTMKRVRGLTLEEIVARLADGEPEAVERFSRRKLLTAFGNVCMAVHFAHARGVLRRDLKPANVMLGDYGEVYVLDWGLAKLIGRPDASIEQPVVAEPAVFGRTAHGAMLGTPGYMAPEQVRGEIDRLDARTDVYSLGAILFELLTLTPLHARSSVAEVIAGTLSDCEARPSVRAPEREVPPELEAICERATRLDPAARFSSAGELNDAVERFLDGDRDLSLRRELAEQHAELAREAADVALSRGLIGERQRALREAGRALALDATHASAQRTLLRLITEPPSELPKSAQLEAETLAQQEQRAAARLGVYIYLSWFLLTPMVMWMGVRGWRALFLSGATYAAAALTCFAVMKRPDRRGRVSLWLLLTSALAVESTGLLFGPYLILPSLAAINAMSFMMSRDGSRRRLVVAVAWLTLLGPLVLEWSGLLPPSYAFHDGVMVILPTLVNLPPLATNVFLVALNIAVIGVASLLIARMRDVLTATDRRLQLHLWQLRQLVPDEARAALPVALPEDSPDCTLGPSAIRDAVMRR